MWFFIFAVMMIFAGLTSGYIVQQGGKFWVNITMPSGFNWSTIIIFISSTFLLIAVKAAKKDNQKRVKVSLGLSLVGGILFGIFQFVGFSQLVDKGSTVVSNIMNLKGSYGSYYKLYYENKEITYNNTRFFLRGEEVSEDFKEKMKVFSREILDNCRGSKKFNLPNYGSEFILKFEDEPITYLNNQLSINNRPLNNSEFDYLYYFSSNIVNDQGDFLVKGEYGVDFWIYYKSENLDYKHRKFYID